MDIKVQHFFDAAHQLPDSEDLVSKGCANLHGHTYKVEVQAHGHHLNGGMLIDFKAVKQVIDKLDHTTILMVGNPLIDILHEQFVSGKAINDVLVLNEEPTAENIAKHIYNELEPSFKARRIGSLEVAVCEGYKGESRSNWVRYDNHEAAIHSGHTHSGATAVKMSGKSKEEMIEGLKKALGGGAIEIEMEEINLGDE